jgi:transcriptional regulator GlxA family with amidase domain
MQELEDGNLLDKIVHLLEEKRRYKYAYFDEEKLAEMLGMSVRQLDKDLHEKLGLNLWDFLAEFRIQKVMEILDKEIFHQRSVYYFRHSGFQSKVSFDRIFKRKTGMSLENYVKRIRAQEKKEGSTLAQITENPVFQSL